MGRHFRSDEFKVSVFAPQPESTTVVDIFRKRGAFNWEKRYTHRIGGNVRESARRIGQAILDSTGDKSTWL